MLLLRGVLGRLCVSPDHIRRTTPQLYGPYLDERESGSWLQGLVFMFHLIEHVLLHPLFLKDLPLVHHVEEGARGHGDGDGIAGLGLVWWKTLRDIHFKTKANTQQHNTTPASSEKERRSTGSKDPESYTLTSTFSFQQITYRSRFLCFQVLEKNFGRLPVFLVGAVFRMYIVCFDITHISKSVYALEPPLSETEVSRKCARLWWACPRTVTQEVRTRLTRLRPGFFSGCLA